MWDGLDLILEIFIWMLVIVYTEKQINLEYLTTISKSCKIRSGQVFIFVQY